MTHKCKICGGSIVVDEITRIATCEYCGTKQTMPLFSEDSERLLYESGNNYLLHSEYDKAENVFNQLLTINPNAAELYWDLVLCKYGVTYVKDPKTEKYTPTCNRTHYTPIFSDENYKKATGDNSPSVLLSTASPYKFPQSVYKAITGKNITDAFDASKKLYNLTGEPIPEQILNLKSKEVRYTGVAEKEKLFLEVLDFIKN